MKGSYRMEFVTNVLTVAWALRWVIVLIAFAVLGCLYSAALMENRELRTRIEKRDRTIQILRGLVATRRHRAPVLVGRVRQ